MAVPKYHEFFPAFLTALKDGEAHSMKEVVRFCADAFHLSEEDRTLTMASGKEYLPSEWGGQERILRKPVLSPERRGLCTSLLKKVFAWPTVRQTR